MDAHELRELLLTTAAAPAQPTLAARTAPHCQPVNLPAGGVLILPGSDPVTLTAAAAYKPLCTPATQPAIIVGNGGAPDISDVTGNSGLTIDEAAGGPGPQYSSLQDPFYASTFPQCYALAATTVISYTLVIMLFITPRSFLDGGVVVLGNRGFTNSGSGGTNIGGRPWLQKVAALTVAISLTIATADTFRVAENQYTLGIPNASQLQTEVLGGTELKVIRIISDTFLWLAQAQTLIRIFPRHREKVIIKWTAFALILLDVLFNSLDSFLYTTSGRTFTDAIPALSYLFQLALGVLYAAWVIYYAIMKKRYAFYHPRMRNICLVAVLSLLSLLVPVVFFVLDISKPDFTGWGDYVRWVGAAAASVIVWEWVERIEALEREEKKDGILGREVFDGDEMLEVTPSDLWLRRQKGKGGGGRGGDDGESGGDARDQKHFATARSRILPTMSSMIGNRYRSRSRPRRREGEQADEDPDARQAGSHGDGSSATRPTQPPLWPARPPQAVTPVSRTDTASADSTIYAVRYHTLSVNTSSQATEHPSSPSVRGQMQQQQPPIISRSSSTVSSNYGQDSTVTEVRQSSSTRGPETASARRWRALAGAMPPFGRIPRAEKAEATATVTEDGEPRRTNQFQHEETSKWDIRARLEDFAATQAERLREKVRPTIDTSNLPVVIIPAPPRRGAALAQVLEEVENSQQSSVTQVQRSASGSSTLSSSGASAPAARAPVRAAAAASPSAGPATTAATSSSWSPDAHDAGAPPALWRSNSSDSLSAMTRPRPQLHSSPHGPSVTFDALPRRDAAEQEASGPAQSVAMGKRPAGASYNGSGSGSS